VTQSSVCDFITLYTVPNGYTHTHVYTETQPPKRYMQTSRQIECPKTNPNQTMPILSSRPPIMQRKRKTPRKTPFPMSYHVRHNLGPGYMPKPGQFIRSHGEPR
jgi:hypothetical protein